MSRSAMASRLGHSYSNIYNSDASRSHLGDVYNSYGPSPDQQAFRAVLDSLRYDGMDDRRDQLNNAERGTFRWILTGKEEAIPSHRNAEPNDDVRIPHETINRNFKSWLDSEDNTIFAFMGKPGSGKSTLM
jgi:hypothetical protein